MSGRSHEGSLHGGKKTKKVQGCVDRVTGGIVVVLVRHPDDPEVFQEIYVPIEKFNNRVPEPGEYVSVSVSRNAG